MFLLGGRRRPSDGPRLRPGRDTVMDDDVDVDLDAIRDERVRSAPIPPRVLVAGHWLRLPPELPFSARQALQAGDTARYVRRLLGEQQWARLQPIDDQDVELLRAGLAAAGGCVSNDVASRRPSDG